MTHKEFECQIGRLGTQWRGTYGEERKAILWRAFQNVPVEDFTSAVEHCLATMRGAPLLDELSKEVDQAKTRRVSSEGYRGVGGFGETLADLAKNSRGASADFVKACMKLWSDYSSRKITFEHFQQGCALLDQAERAMRGPIEVDKSKQPNLAGVSGRDRAAQSGDDNE